MILKASVRANGQDLARHLTRTDENEHVEVFRLDGFTGETLHEAFKEAHAISRATKCEKYLFSLSLSPPETATVPNDMFERTIAAIEKKLGLEGLPKVVVFHEKNGRRHAHCVWQRVDPETLKARPMPYFKFKLRDVSRDLYFEHGWKMPPGLVNSSSRDLERLTLQEWQQAKRQNADPREIKSLLVECWAASDSGKTFANALRERGFRLAKGDRRSFVVVDFKGEVFSLPRWLGVATKRVRERLGPEEALSTVEEALRDFSQQISPMLQRHLDTIARERQRGAAAAAHARSQIVARQRLERVQLSELQRKRADQEACVRAARTPGGLRGLWSWLTGRSGRLRRDNETDLKRCNQRDTTERETLGQRQRAERQILQQRIRRVAERSRANVLELRRDIGRYAEGVQPAYRLAGPEIDSPGLG